MVYLLPSRMPLDIVLMRDPSRILEVEPSVTSELPAPPLVLLRVLRREVLSIVAPVGVLSLVASPAPIGRLLVVELVLEEARVLIRRARGGGLIKNNLLDVIGMKIQ